MHRHIFQSAILAVAATTWLDASRGQTLFTIEGVTLGKSKTEALENGFKPEIFEGTEYLVRDTKTDSAFRRTVMLGTARTDNSNDKERVASINVSQLYSYNEEGRVKCAEAALEFESASRKAIGSSAETLKPRILGSDLTSYLRTVHAARFQSGSLEVNSTCVAKRFNGVPMYSLDFTAG